MPVMDSLSVIGHRCPEMDSEAWKRRGVEVQSAE